MTQLNSTALRRELLLEAAINEQLDTIIALATDTVLLLPRNTVMEENQLRNLLNAALETKSVEATANFIRYQIARKERDWNTALDGFGHAIIRHITSDLAKMAQQVVLRASEQFQKVADAGLIDTNSSATDAIVLDIEWVVAQQPAIQKRLMYLFLGYVNTTFYFYKKSIDRSKDPKTSNALNDAITSLRQVAGVSQAKGAANG